MLENDPSATNGSLPLGALELAIDQSSNTSIWQSKKHVRQMLEHCDATSEVFCWNSKRYSNVRYSRQSWPSASKGITSVAALKVQRGANHARSQPRSFPELKFRVHRIGAAADFRQLLCAEEEAFHPDRCPATNPCSTFATVVNCEANSCKPYPSDCSFDD